MSPDQDNDELQHIRAYLNARLDSFLRRASFHLPTGVGSRGKPRLTRQSAPLTADQGAGPSAAPASSRLDLKGMRAFPDDERSLRALAKEIKRLITEDIKRGIGFGA